MSLSLSSRRSVRWVGTPLLVVISSPSGGGKSTVIRHLRDRHPEFLYSVSVTTRPRRRGERTGTHYVFVSQTEFDKLVRGNRLVEWARVHDHSYGTPRSNIRQAQRDRRVMLFDLDVQGAAEIKKSEPAVVSIFLLPPSWEILKKRLAGRGSETVGQRRLRLRTAREELKRKTEYDYWVTNDRLATCVSDCEAIIRAETLKRVRVAAKRRRAA